MNNLEQRFWDSIVAGGLPRFRFLRRSTPVARVDAELQQSCEWRQLREQLRPGDCIWPFRYPRSKWLWGWHSGYVVLRDGRFVGGVVKEVS